MAMKEPLTEERGKGGDKHFSWLYKLAGKNNRTKDDISPALRAHTEDLKREVENAKRDSLGAPQRSRSVSVASSEKKDTRRKSLADVFTTRNNETEKTLVKFAKEEEKVAKVKKDHEKGSKPQTEAERAMAKAKKREEEALAARSEATRLIAEANKAFAAAAKATADAAQKTEVDLLTVEQNSRISSSIDRGTTELDISQNSTTEDSMKKGTEDPSCSFTSTSTSCLGNVVEDPKERKSDSPRESTSRNGGLFSSLSKKVTPGHINAHLAIDEDHTRSSSISARETKLRNEYALVAERAAKKAIKQATRAKHEAELALTKATEVESKQQAKEAKRRGRSPKAWGKKHDLEVHNDPDSATRKSTSVNDLERMPSTSSLSIPTLTLNEVLASEGGVAAFKQFAAEGFVLENISFVLEVRAFDLLDETAVGTEAWQKRANEIFNTYVQVGSLQEVNVTSKIRKDVVEKFEAGTISPGVFKGLAAEALRILRTNDWPQFIKSEHYRKFEASTLAESSP
jgi:hypothetical protein